MKFIMKTIVTTDEGSLHWTSLKGYHFKLRKQVVMWLAKGEWTHRDSNRWSEGLSAGHMVTLPGCQEMGEVKFYVDEVPQWGKRLVTGYWSLTEQQYHKWNGRFQSTANGDFFSGP